MDKDKKRAISDYRCAARKLRDLFDSLGMHNEAGSLNSDIDYYTKAFKQAKEKDNG
jgi:hypothetical protein